MGARRGARMLDEKHPGWYGRVDTGSIDLFSREDCILGQMYGDFGHGLVKLGQREHWVTVPWAIRHGFITANPLVPQNRLRRRWVIEIEKRHTRDYVQALRQGLLDDQVEVTPEVPQRRHLTAV